MAKMTALRLAQKPKKEEKQMERKGRSLVNNPTSNTTKNIQNNLYKGKPLQQPVKLPKVPNSSTKNIESKKPNEGIFRITNSKESRR